jgi:hypothetical protein
MSVRLPVCPSVRLHGKKLAETLWNVVIILLGDFITIVDVLQFR